MKLPSVFVFFAFRRRIKLTISQSMIAPEVKRTAVKLAASICWCCSASLHRILLAAKAIMVTSVSMRGNKFRCFIGRSVGSCCRFFMGVAVQ